MSDDEGYEEATPEQKINIATYFLMSSPTGEVDSVLTDVRKLVNDDNVFDDVAQAKILRAYNCEQLVAAKDPEGDGSIIVSAHGQVADDQYVDPSTGRVLRFDHKKRTFLDVTEKKQVLAPAVQGYRDAVDKHVKQYVSGAYKNEKCTVGVYGSDKGVLTICLSAANVNLGNFWTGGWRATYTLDVSGRGSKSLKGSIKVNVHYFEDGNVQLHTNIDQDAKIDVGAEDDTGKEVAAAINKIETDFQSNLEEMYVNMHRTTFKAMRRFLPITKQPMNWNVAAHQIANDIKK
jgi:capping protein alpha